MSTYTMSSSTVNQFDHLPRDTFSCERRWIRCVPFLSGPAPVQPWLLYKDMGTGNDVGQVWYVSSVLTCVLCSRARCTRLPPTLRTSAETHPPTRPPSPQAACLQALFSVSTVCCRSRFNLTQPALRIQKSNFSQFFSL